MKTQAEKNLWKLFSILLNLHAREARVSCVILNGNCLMCVISTEEENSMKSNDCGFCGFLCEEEKVNNLLLLKKN